MNHSIIEAMRKHHPEGAVGGIRLVPARHDRHPDYIRAGKKLQSSVASDPLGDTLPVPPGLLRRNRQALVSLGLLFGLALAVGTGIGLRPARMGEVAALSAPAPAPVHLEAPVSVQPPAALPDPVQPASAVPLPEPATVLAAEPAQLPAGPAEDPLLITPDQPEQAIMPIMMVGDLSLVPPAPMPQAPPPPVYHPELELAAPLPPVQTLAATGRGDLPEVLYEAEWSESLEPREDSASSARRASVRGDAPTPPPPAPAEKRLEGIFWSKDRPLALIGEQIVEPGDDTPLGRVIEIHPKHLIVERNGRRQTLSM